jgi:HD-like signal output (HDOD) protein
MTNERLARVVEQLPTMPEVALRVVQLVGAKDYDVQELVRVIRTDPALTTRLLKLCNSPLFALRSPVTTVEAALPFLGARNLLKVVVASCTRGYFSGGESGYRCRSGEFWRHGVATAIATQLLAEAAGLDDAGGAFTAGILHNIGKVAIAPVLQEEAGRLAELLQREAVTTFLDVEREIVGIDHAAAGALVIERWPLPTDLAHAIVNHHDAERIATDPPLTALVHLADLLCLQLGIGVGIDGLCYPAAEAAMGRLGLDADGLDELRLSLITEVERHEELINMQAPGGR